MKQIARRRSSLGVTLVAAAACTAALAGCYRPQGALLSYTGGAQTYYSTETSPKTIVVVDTRDDEVILEVDVPAGQQFTYDFIEEGGPDPVERPSVMRYDLMPIGTRYGKLRTMIPVPNRFSRRVDFYVREGVEYAPEPPEYRMRTDRLEDRPDWWTPEGGEYTDDDAKTTMYDD